MEVSNEYIIHYLHNHPGIKTEVIHGRIRDEINNILTHFFVCLATYLVLLKVSFLQFFILLPI